MSERATPPTDPPVSAPLIDYRQTPAGVMPRQLQRWLLLGISVVMVGIMALSGSSTRSRSASTAPSATAAVVDPNQQRIEEYQRRIQEQTQRLAAEQAALHVAKDAAGAAPDALAQSGRASPVPQAGSERSTPSDSLRHERDQRRYHSLFADNVAFRREPPAGEPHASAPAPAAASSATPTDVPPSGLTAAPGPPRTPVAADAPASVAPSGPSAPPARSARAPVTPPTASGERLYSVPEGTIIETVLTNRLDGTYAGPVNTLVTTAVYAPDRQHLLIPAGARVLGDARAVSTFGQSRLAVVFHRLLLPNGSRIDLEAFHGLNQIGETGLRDQVDRHYAQIFGASLAVGAIAGLAQTQASVGLDASAFDAYRLGAASNLAQSSARILDRFLNLLPTVTIREGHRIKVYLSNDLELPAYPAEPANRQTSTTGGES